MNNQDLCRLIEPDVGLTEERHTYLKEQLMATILTEVAASQPSQDLLQAWMSHHLAMSKANSRLSVSFLLRIGVRLRLF